MSGTAAALSETALEHWERGRWRESVKVLKEIDTTLASEAGKEETRGPVRAKLLHNLKLANFAATQPSPPLSELLASLDEVTGDILEELRREGGHVDAEASASEEGASSSSSGGKPRFQPDASFAMYNQAVVKVAMRQWRSALTTLEDLFCFLDAVDESLALCVCFLLLDVYALVARGADNGDGGAMLGLIGEKAQSVIDFLERPHGFNRQGRWTGSGKESLMAVEKGDQQKEKEEVVGEAENEKSQIVRVWTNEEVRGVRMRLVSYKLKFSLLQATASAAKGSNGDGVVAQEILTQFHEELADESWNEGPKTAVKDSVTSSGSAWEGVPLHRLRKRDHHQQQQQQQQQSLDLVKEEEEMKSMVACLKANMELIKKEYGWALKHLREAVEGKLDNGIYLNNIGCIHHQLGKHRTAAVYFSKALESFEKRDFLEKENCVPETTFNLGVQLLRSGQPQHAFESFMNASVAMFHRPQLWLHVAECVVLAHCKRTKDSNASMLRGVAGDGTLRRILLNTSSFGHFDHLEKRIAPAASRSAGKTTKGKPSTHGQPEENDDHGKLSLQTGLRAANHALHLLSTLESGPGVSTLSISSQSESESTRAGLDSDVENSRKESLEMKQLALLCKAYLALWTQDWCLAFKACVEVVSLSNSPVAHKIKGEAAILHSAHAYLAEAALRSNANDPFTTRPSIKEVVHAIQTEMTSNRPDSDAKSAMCINVALVRIAQGELVQAENLLVRALDMSPDSLGAIRVLTYLYLCRGEHDKARRLLKTSR